ncbi:hypothetical protein EV383_4495 [Pseudonocardia sediminis]|uniref:Uncharacterized protein n=1 Tax=Pseudonocardia sediminis TaxID=1397368 RepID=A0A4V2FR80_PSEST|nr:hypothetical protein [Pseudonocardia sediminis]RZT87570.1 hypothetical protein EV383_4495 [Pseudonocardia sediminis]
MPEVPHVTPPPPDDAAVPVAPAVSREAAYGALEDVSGYHHPFTGAPMDFEVEKVRVRGTWMSTVHVSHLRRALDQGVVSPDRVVLKLAQARLLLRPVSS